MWPEAIASDEAAAAAADAKVAKDALPVTAQDFHPLSWLVYEYAQAGRFSDAHRTLERLRGPAEATKDPRLLAMLATLRSRLAIEEQNWTVLPGPGFVNYEELFAVGLSAANRGDMSLAERARMRLSEMAQSPRYTDRRVLLEIMALQMGAAIRAKSNDVDGALALLADATRAERSLPASIGPPPLMKPAQEQYAELLLETGRADEAVAQFGGALERARNRRASVAGLERARAALSTNTSAKRTAGGASGLLILLILVMAARRRRQSPAKSPAGRQTKSRGQKPA
jgi:tetratricopeptide (TPR) repeat protein